MGLITLGQIKSSGARINGTIHNKNMFCLTVDPGCGHVGFVVDKVALGQVFSEYFGFPCQSSFHQLLHIHISPGAGTIGQSGRSTRDLVPPH
jgi:hypothetical protein